ncbi:hypothetical protein B9Z55_007947 [Caenorhabditis nigoni]|uniref:Uncharacterized protein n=1 Tax=Caenorhabditis nigoni TaxID=1611254 RepID=A0A2G5VC85_9PELO|nr:hypothetical protein B9Z55_007947 [Caenorhabditis nigoni]
MKELVWSDDLAHEQLVTKVVQFNEKRYTTFLLETYQEHLNKFLDDTSKIRRNPENNTDIRTTQYLFPLFEKIGCNEEQEGDKNVTYCYFSPGIPDEYMDKRYDARFLFLDSGEAGSKCGNGYENNDGLCKATFSTVTSNTKEKTTGNSENDVTNEPSSSYSIFSMVHILVVLGFGFSIFN